MTVDPTMAEEEARKLREQGIPDELIEQLLGMGEYDPTDLARQYTAGGWLRRSATSGDFAKTPFGALAQGLGGYMVGQQDKDYATAVRDYRKTQTSAKKAFYKSKFPKKQITDVPSMEDYGPGDREEPETGFFYGGS